MLAVGGVEDDGVPGVLLHVAGANHLAEDLTRGLSLVRLLFQHSNPSLEFSQFSEFAGVRLFFEENSGLVVLDLLLGPSSFGARLQHVGRDAFGDCRENTR